MSSGSQSVAANTTPAMTTSRLPMTQHPTPAEPVGVRREPQRDDRVADEGECQDRPDRQRIETCCGQVQDEDDGKEAVPEHPHGPEREQDPTVGSEIAQAGEKRRVHLGPARGSWIGHDRRSL